LLSPSINTTIKPMQISPIKCILLLLSLLIFSDLYSSDAVIDSTNTQISKPDTLRLPARSPRRAMTYSLVFPGLGQLYNRKYFKAILIFGGEVGLLTNSIYLNQQYRKTNDPLEEEFYINNRNLSTWWLVGVLLYSALDAYVDAHMADFDESPDLGLKFELNEQNNRKIYLTYTHSF